MIDYACDKKETAWQKGPRSFNAWIYLFALWSCVQQRIHRKAIRYVYQGYHENGRYAVRLSLSIWLLFSLPYIAFAIDKVDNGTTARPAGSTIVPDKFLRRWDPVTVFFDSAIGPAQGGPEERPERYVTLAPAHPGVYTWRDARTLQYRPVQPWPPLTRFNWIVNKRSYVLTTLMESPLSSLPADGAEGLAPVEHITLTFAEPLDPQALQRMLRIGWRPLPGIDDSQTRWLTEKDFSIKVIERRDRNDPANYVVQLQQPIPHGVRAIVRLSLAVEDEATAFRDLSFSTAEDFRVIRFGCANNSFPITPDGVRYPRDQAIACATDERTIYIEFSSAPKKLSILEARNLVRFTPAVEGLTVKTSGKRLTLRGKFQSDRVYRLALHATPLTDAHARPLRMSGASEAYVYFPAKPNYLQLRVGHGIVERYGPQQVALEGRGFSRADVRIYPVDPLQRSFWPFPETPVAVDEATRPAGPGEEPRPHQMPEWHIAAEALAAQLKNLGAPPISTLIDLPLKQANGAARFGVNLAPHFARLAGARQPGTYLVGVRPLDAGTQRYWARIQVTDLSLTTIEEPDAVKFAVTSLSTGKPLSGVEISVEGAQRGGRNNLSTWQTVITGRTGGDGTYRWALPSTAPTDTTQLLRVVIKDGRDVLVLDATRPPDAYADNVWRRAGNAWLQWTRNSASSRAEPVKRLCHLFTERPLYRPEEHVYFKGYVRTRHAGALGFYRGSVKLIVHGPGEFERTYALQLTALSSLTHIFKEEDTPTGEYRARLELDHGESCGEVRFSKEAYRLPEFEVQLHAPDEIAQDREFKVQLTARYYAGGQVTARPVRWRVTQFPYAWQPPTRPGFFYSSDGRFSDRQRFQAEPAVHHEGKTDEQGHALLALDPARELTSEPRSYVIEATVTGADDQTVTHTKRVLALPAAVLGLQVPRYLERAQKIKAQIIAVAPDGKLLADQPITVRLLKREWHSHLQAGDFAQGEAKYITEVVDQKISAQTIRSAAEVQSIELALRGAGVYVVELETHDALGRAQVVAVDLYAGGDEPVSWSRPPNDVFKVTPDRSSYTPGDTAHLILESPFQDAQALAIVETPQGNRYQWLTLHGGKATFDVRVEPTFVPRLPVHFVLMRGRLLNVTPLPGMNMDLGKPATVAATAWIKVEPVAHQAKVTLTYPESAKPGDTVTVKITVTDPQDRPLAGEATLWLVDQAVLALASEQRLDPLPDFITEVRSRVTVHDTRNWTLGLLPLQEQPGGDMRMESAAGLLDRATVRRDFRSVPYFNPAIEIGVSGVASVQIKLPDNLTVFKLRAKVASSSDRFGVATGTLNIRLPVIVQPALPRFVRPGDRFVASALGRVVQGSGGAGSAQMRVQGLTLTESPRKTLTLQPNIAQRIDFHVSVPLPPLDANGQAEYDAVKIAMAVERTADRASDAFEVTLPVRPDRAPVVEQQLVDIKPGEEFSLPALAVPVRAGSLRRSVFIAQQPALVRMAAGLSFALDYPHGCTEQRLSRAQAWLAFKSFNARLALGDSKRNPENVITEMLTWLPGVVDQASGLVSYWPGARGYVSLTAWTLEFMVQARAAGFNTDTALTERFVQSLKQALRADYRHWITGEEYTERVLALRALAAAGQLDTAYLAELARRSEYMNLESTAEVVRLLRLNGNPSPATTELLATKLRHGVITRLHQNREIYGGLQDTARVRNGLILPSETRTVATLVRAGAVNSTTDARQQLLIDTLVNLGRGNGWGTTNANTAALLALSEVLRAAPRQGASSQVKLRMDDKERMLELNHANPIAQLVGATGASLRVWHEPGAQKKPLAVRIETRYVAQAPGSHVAASAHGFVITRELQHFQGQNKLAAKILLDTPDKVLRLTVGDVVEDHVVVVTPDATHHVAIAVPLAAGLEPLNPRLATAPPEATPTGTLTLAPSYAAYLDDQVVFYYDTLPKGTYHFYFRTRATVAGHYTQPAARAELMYNEAVYGTTPGARIEVMSPPARP